MKRFAVVLGLVVLSGACDKPAEEDCRKAISNVRTLLGTQDTPGDLEGDIRRCKGGSKKQNVECAKNATSLEQLKACEFFKVPEKKQGAADGSGAGAGATAGSAGGPAGSATGSSAGSAP
ncbi:MAG TPA: hypothetical protein VNO30_17445 [Kofleriaceae bacterium]|nr:hypothetical protein [Kofleriaceae bacterium]